ncbi:LysR family transcriptional regulator [Paraburkholderia lacunae]|uniref:LysR family transcriptional regulator n=1 Tax=Paraburkholderia lacunae TaxID=2211104 RepID=A0A370NBJ6_9BURK|nr:LysR family transcriptional regulator [Paraburkholderia lacunae]RDK02980.1 LysR family transcriptional regulator [Paraburkholderia lacunae]
MDILQSIRAFVAVANASSFTSAARQMRVSTPQVSRAIAELETHLGLRLLRRTTRSVALTAAGDRYLVHSKFILDRLELAEAEAAGLCAKPVGTLRIGVDPTFDAHHLAWLINAYQARYPEVTVQTSLVGGSLDAALDTHDTILLCNSVPQIESMVFERAGATSTVLCASPIYLASHGVPETISELRGHSCLQLKRMDDASEPWLFEGLAGPEVFRCDQTRLLTDTTDVLVNVIQGGGGIGQLSLSRALPALRSGALVRVLPQYRLATRNVYVLCPSAHYGEPKVQAWFEFVKAALPGRLAEDQVSLISYLSNTSESPRTVEAGVAAEVQS